MTMLHTISFSELYLWDVNRFFSKDEFLSSYGFVLLGEILEQQFNYEEILSDREYLLCGLSAYGNGLFHREVKSGKEIKGNKLNQIVSDQFIYSRLGANNGAFDLVSEQFNGYWVTNEFPVFKIKSGVNKEYLKILFKLQRYWDSISRKLQGAAHKRFKENLLLELSIPLPPLSEQNRLVDAYNAQIALAKKLEMQAQQLLIKLPEIVNQSLDIKPIEKASQRTSKYLKIISFSNIFKWGVDAQSTTEHQYSTLYPVLRLTELCNVGSGGTPSRSRRDYYGGSIPWVKTAEVINDVIADTEEKITQHAVNDSSAKLYPKGSLIIAMYGQGSTRGRTAKLGIDATTNQACAVLSNIDNYKILTDYLWVYLMSEYNHLRELASGNNQPNLNAQMIKNYPVIVPPLEVQANIISDFFEHKNQIKDLKSKAEQNKADAINSFEKSIFNQ